MSKPALGRGLGALLGGVSADTVSSRLPPASLAGVESTSPSSPRDRVQRVPLDRIRPSPHQPRKDFAPEALQELADSIREQGILQPLIVREAGSHLELIAGERRWRAAQLLGLAEIPVLVREADDRAVLELALIENLQRENLNPMEEALGYAQLVSSFQLRQEDVAAKVGKSRAVVANALRLLKLPPEVQAHLRTGRLSVGHAKVLLSLPLAEDQKLLAEQVVKRMLNVRQTEDCVAQHQAERSKPALAGKAGGPAAGGRDAHVADLENRLREKLGTKVQLRYRNGQGALEVRFFSDAELERVLQIIGVKVD
jgi:ParB family chromosome partitioning protein